MKKLEKKTIENIRPNLYDYLKVFAIIAMIIDHIGYYLYPELEVLRRIGRFAFPIFLFLVGFNGKYTWSRKVFYSALIVQCVMRAMLFYTGPRSFTFNILFSILLARGILAHLVPKFQKKERGFRIFYALWIYVGHILILLIWKILWEIWYLLFI